jgi:hypothetical protein
MVKKARESQSRKRPSARATVSLVDLRNARAVTQMQLKEALGIEQATLSRMERRDDMLVSTLRRYVEALGGDLKLVATFAEGEVEITLL